MRLMKPLITLAMVCLLTVPALSMRCGSMPCGDGRGNGAGAGFWQMDLNLSEEDLNNMTLAEIEALRQEKMDELNNMTVAEIKEQMGRDGNVSCCIRGMNGGPILLMTDVSREDLEGMTLAEIEALRQEKKDELNNMTLSEIEALQAERLTEIDNMTLSELNEQWEVSEIISSGGRHILKGPHGWAGAGGFGMGFGILGACGCDPASCGMGNGLGMMRTGSDGCGFGR